MIAPALAGARRMTDMYAATNGGWPARTGVPHGSAAALHPAGHSFAAYILRFIRPALPMRWPACSGDPLTPEEWIAQHASNAHGWRRGVWFHVQVHSGAVGVIRFLLVALAARNTLFPDESWVLFGARAKETVERILASWPTSTGRGASDPRAMEQPKIFLDHGRLHFAPACVRRRGYRL